MPTKKPRSTITFQPHHYHLLKRFAELQGVSLSGVIGDLVEAAYPPLMRSVALLDAAKDAPSQVKEGLSVALWEIEADLRGKVKEVDQAFEFLDSLSAGGGKDGSL